MQMPNMPPTFRPPWMPKADDARRTRDRDRGSAAARGYDSRWAKASKGFLAANPLCLGCDAVGVVRVAVLTDHTVPHKGDAALFWDRENWQPSCRFCHDRVKARLEDRFAAGRIGADALRLDSREAKALRRALDGGAAG